jgi:hypothetical protein
MAALRQLRWIVGPAGCCRLMARLLAGRKLPTVERPVDAVTAAVLALQMAQRDVNLLIREVIERVSADPFAESSHPDFRIRLSELRADVDREADKLIDALGRMGDTLQPDSD